MLCDQKYPVGNLTCLLQIEGCEEFQAILWGCSG